MVAPTAHRHDEHGPAGHAHDDHDHDDAAARAGPAHGHPGHEPRADAHDDAAHDAHAAHGHHGHAHHVPHDGHFDRAFAIGIAVNLGFVGIEAFWGWRVDSLALLADAGHNLGDVAGLVLAWAGARAARLRPDTRYTYGWKRASILAAFGNAVLLLAAMAWLAWEAVQRLQAPQAVPGVTVMVVAAIGIAVNLGTALLFMRGRENDINLRGAFLHMAADALVSAGVVVAGALALGFGLAWVDPAASLVIAVVIVVGTWGLFRQSLRLLFDGVPDHIDLLAVRRELEAMPGVERIHDLHVWAAGTTETVLTAHLVMPAGRGDDAFLEAATIRLRERFRIGHVTLQVMRRPFMALCDGPAEPPAAMPPRHGEPRTAG